jgi:arylsulfatase A-like enzyme
MADVAPTLLHLLGEAVPPHVEGRVLAAAVREAPSRRDETDAPGAWGGGGPAPLRNASPGAVVRATTSTSTAAPRDVDAREEASLRERLERLGYL